MKAYKLPHQIAANDSGLSLRLRFRVSIQEPPWSSSYAMILPLYSYTQKACPLALVAVLLVLPKGLLETGWLPSLLVVGDTVIASALVYWSGNGVSDLYLTYFLIILLAATTRSLPNASPAPAPST